MALNRQRKVIVQVIGASGTRSKHAVGYRWLPEAIDAGLITFMASCATEFRTLDGQSSGKLLPGSLAYYPWVAAMEKSLDERTGNRKSPQFKVLEIFDTWVTFLYLAKERIADADPCGIRSDYEENICSIHEQQVAAIAGDFRGDGELITHPLPYGFPSILLAARP
ncbi:hypothetical protein B0H19DRAFT_1245456 [Mycena capillaripes]|nr:hypothetical protein B0H19DRAFT_1245456 [Mycena capillaripes]